MQCPICGSKAKVVDTNALPGRTRRKLRCTENSHQFSTEEGRVGWRLAQDVHLRRTGNGQVQDRPFEPARLHREVHDAVLGRLTEAEIANVVDGAISHLRYDVVPKTAELLVGEEYDRIAQARDISQPIAAIADSEVRDAVEKQLRDKEHRLAHVLYALSFKGRRNKPGLTGWSTAEDVLRWLFSDSAYPDVRTDIPPRPDTAVFEWTPTKPTDLPEFVVKQGAEINITIGEGAVAKLSNSDEDAAWPAVVRDRGVVGFLESRFRQSVRQSFFGRPDSEHLTNYVSSWVLHDLQGQRRVSSSQLAIGVLNCLRRVDDIAYLRWVTQRKDFRSIREFRDEALGLITYPSSRLQFSTRGPSYKHTTLVSSPDTEKGPLYKNLSVVASQVDSDAEVFVDDDI